MTINYRHYSLSNLEVVREKKSKAFYLSATYEYEDTNGSKYILSIPRIDLNASVGSNPVFLFGGDNENFIDVGFGGLPIRRDEEGLFMNCKQIEQQPKEMTLEEIEKALGYSVKIVRSKD